MGCLGAVVAAMALFPAAGAGAPRLYRGVVHVHSLLSHDSRGTIGEIAAAARAAGASFVMLTDHPGRGAPAAPPGGFVDGVLMIPGVETAHLLGLGVARDPGGGTTAAVIAAIHRQGGLALAAHPVTFRDWDAPGLDGMEVYDLLDDVRDEFLPWAILRWAWVAPRDPLRALATVLDYPAANLARWDARAARGTFAAVAGVDAHQNIGRGRWRLDPYARQFAFVQTWVEADRLDARALLAGLRGGRSRIVFTVFGDPGPVAWSARAGRITVTGPPGSRIRLVRDGAVLRESGAPLACAVPGPGLYRAEVWTAAGRPWVLTGPRRLTR